MQIAAATRAGVPAWINRRTLLGVVLILVSVAGGRAVMESGKTTVPVWVVGKDLAGGSVLSGEELRVEHVNLPPRLGASYVRASEPLAGMVVTRPLAAGELVPAAWVVPSSPARSRAVAIPVDPEHAVGGALRPGDLVDIYATFDAGDARARTVALLREAEVLDVVSAGGLVMGDRSLIGLTISIDPSEAQRVAFASRTAELDVVRVDVPGATRSIPAVTAGDF